MEVLQLYVIEKYRLEQNEEQWTKSNLDICRSFVACMKKYIPPHMDFEKGIIEKFFLNSLRMARDS